MKKIIWLLISSVAVMAVGGILILTAYLSNREDIDKLNSGFGSVVYDFDEEIIGLKVDATDGVIYVNYGPAPRVSIDDCYMQNISVTVENGILIVKEKFPVTASFSGWELPGFTVGVNDKHKEAITITLPENVALEDTSICMGKGDIRINGLNTKKVNLQVGIGSLTSKVIKNLGKYKYQVAVGNVDLEWLDE